MLFCLSAVTHFKQGRIFTGKVKYKGYLNNSQVQYSGHVSATRYYLNSEYFL